MPSGTKAEAVNAAELIVTDAVFGNASPLMEQTTEKARKRLAPLLARRRSAGGDRLQRRDRRWPADHARPRRLGFLGIDSGRRAGRRASCGSGPMSTAS